MIPAKTLFDAVALATKLTARGGSMPILSQIRLQTEDGRFTVRASDAQTYVTVVGQGGAAPNPIDVCVEGRMLNGLLTNLKKANDVVAFEVDGKAFGSPLKMTVGGRNFKLQTTAAAGDAGDATSTGNSAGRFTLDEKRLAGIAWVADAVSTDETRYNMGMGGVYFNKGEVVATDSHRLHKVRLSAAEEMPFSGILSASAQALLQAARKATGAASATVEGFGGGPVTPGAGWGAGDVNLFVITLAGKGLSVRIESRAIEGAYPPYASVIPRNTEAIALLSAPALDATLLLAGKMGPERSIKGVRLNANGVLDVSVEVEGRVVFQEELVCQTTTPLEWALNIPYLRAAIEGIEGSVEIRGSDAKSPFVFLSPDFPERYALLMPMRL